jgi:hypothetical protein
VTAKKSARRGRCAGTCGGIVLSQTFDDIGAGLDVTGNPRNGNLAEKLGDTPDEAT